MADADTGFFWVFGYPGQGYEIKWSTRLVFVRLADLQRVDPPRHGPITGDNAIYQQLREAGDHYLHY